MNAIQKLRQDNVQTLCEPVRGVDLHPGTGLLPRRRQAGKLFNRWDWWSVIIALAFAGWSLRSIGEYSLVQTDAARHAMNGAFLHDLIAQGQWAHALEFARTYYAHLPALTLPYHPPMFPLIEAVFFTLFGVNVFAARLAVALAVFVSALVLFGLVKETSRSRLVAAASTITFLCLPEALFTGSEVMLEFPALVFTLLAINLLRSVDTDYSLRPALAYAALATAAMWTRQQMVFLGATPVLYLIFLGRWRLLRQSPVWVSSTLFLVLTAAVVSLSLPVRGAGVTQVIPSAAPHAHHSTYASLFTRNVAYYASHYYGVTGPAGLILLAAILAALALRVFDRRTLALYAAWVLSSLMVLFLIRPFTTRYLLFTYPAIIALGYTGLVRVIEYAGLRRYWTIAAAGAVAITALVQFPYRTQFLHGPREAARILAAVKPSRILYCGGSDGHFVFYYRELRAGLDTVIIAGDKLPHKTFTAEQLVNFAHDYGIQYIVLEHAPQAVSKQPWVPLMSSPPSEMVPEQDIQLVGSNPRGNGILRVYRFTNPATRAKDHLSLHMFMIGGSMDFNLGR